MQEAVLVRQTYVEDGALAVITQVVLGPGGQQSAVDKFASRMK